MNKAFEKILDRLEELRETYDEMAFIEMNTNGHTLDFEYAKGKKDVMLDVKKIVQEVAEEYNGGWIPCSERLPEIGQEVIVATKNGSVFSNIYYDYTDSNAKEPCFHSWDDEMWNCFEPDVIAWQPLPEPFKERD